MPDFSSREYKVFREEERFASLPKTFYEKACNLSAKIFNITPDKKAAEAFQKAIEFSHLKTTPKGIASITVFFAFAICFPALILAVLDMFFGISVLPFGYGMMVMLLSVPFIYYLYTYPMHLKKIYEVETGSEIVTMVLYTAMFLRNAPNLERAINFASENLTGPLSFEMKKLMWDVEVGNYLTMEEAVLDYSKKWSNIKEFVEAVEIIITSLRQVTEQRVKLLDEAIDIILEGNRERAKHFNQDLRTPVMIVHALGIILPILGLILFPLVSVFLGVGASALFIGYDVLLPVILLFVIINILESRPPTFSTIDISENPDVPPKGKFAFGKNKAFLPALPFSLAVGGIFAVIGLAILYMQGQEGVISPLFITAGAAAAFSLQYYLLTFQRMAIREKTIAIEGEFSEILFQLGNHVYSGVPIEMSVEQATRRAKELKIRDLFMKALHNMRNLGMTFGQSFFDKEYGAIRYYPSRLIKSVMKTVVEASQKGAKTASLAMLSVSRYLKGLHETQEDIREQLSEPVSSMKFQLFFLSPMISGVIVTLTTMMLQILEELSIKTKDLPFGFPWDLSHVSITNFQFIIVVAVYVIETCFILSFFVNGIENGRDDIGRRNLTSRALAVGFAVFVLTLTITLAIFGPLISGDTALSRLL